MTLCLSNGFGGCTITQIANGRRLCVGYTTWLKPHPFFVKDLSHLLHLFSSSTRWETDTQTMRWQWESNGLFSCSSVYRMIHNTGVICLYQRFVWHIKAPVKVRIWVWLLLANRYLTQEVLTNRGCPVAEGCKLCSRDILETRDHLLCSCIFVRRFWCNLTAQLNVRLHGTWTSIVNMWWHERKLMPRQGRE